MSFGVNGLYLTGALVGGALLFLIVRTLILRSRTARWRALPPIRLRHSVVMLHGILGFDRVGLWGLEQEYFRGIWRFLELLGVDVSYPRVPMVGSIPQRAEALAAHVRALPDRPVILLAHSMGGLDARYAIHALGLDQHVCALVTVGTPHRGTSLADLSAQTVPRLFRWGLRKIGLDTPALDDLTRDSARRFNDSVHDSTRVAYFSVVASAGVWTLLFNPALWLSHFYVRRREGPNDGLVAARSQQWGAVLEEVDADHWSQIGWTLRFDARQLYERILRQLETRGF